ncbi:hypothetical protein BDR26DRAFT_860943 [Obelidium mucronatum]|nr:hypothetical protein BDR26DRAFT_860943 [Obelidium mucronatum]
MIKLLLLILNLRSISAQPATSNAVLSPLTTTSSSGVPASIPTSNPLSTVACGPATLEDYGFLPLTSTILSTKSSNPATDSTSITYSVLDSGQLIVSRTTFSQEAINNPTKSTQNPIQVFAPALLIKEINSNVATNITILVSDQFANTLTCYLTVTVKYTFAPFLNPASSLSIETVAGQPVIISASSSPIFQILEKHSLSTWNLHLTPSGTYSQGNYGILEYYSTNARSWLPIPLTQNIPYSWIDQSALRYNPISFVGTFDLILTVGTTKGFKLTQWLDPKTQSMTLSASIKIVSSAPTNSTIITAIPVPPAANMQCFTSYPSRFVPSSITPIGPYCSNFTVRAGIPTLMTVTPFLGAQISLTTSIDAIVYFGTAVAPTSDYIPTGYTPLKFAGYLDFGAWYIYLSPTSATITSGSPPSLTFISPEIAYEEIIAGVTQSEISGLAFDPIAKTSTQFFPQNLNLNPGPPHVTMSLATLGMFMLLQSSSIGGTGAKVNVGFGQVQYLGTWKSRTFMYPASNNGNFQLTIQCNTDMQMVVLDKCATFWIPGGAGKFDCFTLTVTTQSASALVLNATLQYDWSIPMTQAVNPDNIKWTHFISSLDGGNWDESIPSSLNVNTGTVVVSVNAKQLGQWGLFGMPSSAKRLLSSSALALLAASLLLSL